MTNAHRGERGAIATIVAMLFGLGVLLGAGALTVDVGNINAERRQLQNGADAAALSAARDCAGGACPNTAVPADMARLTALTDGNAKDGRDWPRAPRPRTRRTSRSARRPSCRQ